MDHLLRDNPFAWGYFDDISIVADEHNQHLPHLGRVLATSPLAKLGTPTNVSEINGIKYFGYSISSDGMGPSSR